MKILFAFAPILAATVAVEGLTIEDGRLLARQDAEGLFYNQRNSLAPGPATLLVDPQFVSVTDFRLQTGSPARDAGQRARVPGDIAFDLDRAPRVQGVAVELGVYESTQDSALEVPTLQGWSAGALVLGLCAVVWTSLRRRPRRSRNSRRSHHTLRSPFARSLAGLVFAIALPRQSSAATWPSASCAGTLQQCIDTAAIGEIVEISTDGPIDESPHLTKNQTLRPAPGFTPVFAGTWAVFVDGGDANVTAVVEGLTFNSGGVFARQEGSGVLDVRIADNIIRIHSGSGISVTSTNNEPPYGPVLFEISGNRLEVNFDPGDSFPALAVGGFQSVGGGRIERNVIVANGPGTNSRGMIEVLGHQSVLVVDVVANDIRGAGFRNGISVVQDDSQDPSTGRATVRVLDNLIIGQTDVVADGPRGGIVVSSARGTLSTTVINNTVAVGDTGLVVTKELGTGGVLFGVIANNIVAHHSVEGVSIDPALFAASDVPNDHNLLFDNASNLWSPGPGTLDADPLFVSVADFRLQEASPARNAGSNLRVPGDLLADLAGQPRIQGAAVDLGAYESPGSVLEIPVLGAWGTGTLVAGLSVAAWASLRRRAR